MIMRVRNLAKGCLTNWKITIINQHHPNESVWEKKFVGFYKIKQ